MDSQLETIEDETTERDEEAGSPEVDFDKLKEWRQQAEDHWTSPHDECRRLIPFSYAAKDMQWDPDTLQRRKDAKLPTKQFGFTNGMVLQVINPIRENPPKGAIKPVGMGYQAKQDAQVLTGVIRGDENLCDAESAYFDALESSVRGGLGAWRYLVDKDDGKWQVRIVPTNGDDVFYDPTAQLADYSDARWCLIRCVMSEFDYVTQYPRGSATPSDGKVTVYEAYVKDHIHVMEAEIGDQGAVMTPKLKPIVRYFCFDDEKILAEDNEYLGPDIPVVLETAPSAMIDGVRCFFPLTHHVEEAQKASNFWQNDAIFEMSTRPRNRFFAKAGSQVNPDDWANSAFDASKTTLHWDGETMPIEREAAEPPVGFLHMANSALDSARVATNIYPDPALQSKMDAPSGEAVKQQRAGSGVANYQHTDCHYKAIKRGTRIHVNLIAAYYNDDQIRESVGNDGSTMRVSLGPTKVEGVHNIDLETVKYMVTVDISPSYSTQREQAQDQWMEFGSKSKDPAFQQLITYWLLKQSPLQGSEDVADWYLATMPQNIQQAIQMKNQVAGSEMDPQQMIREIVNLRGENQKMTLTIQGLVEALKKETAELQSKQSDLESRERIAEGANQTKLHGQAMEITSRHQLADEQSQRDTQLQSMEAAMNERIEMMRAENAQVIQDMKAQLELILQERENASDAALASKQGAHTYIDS